MLLVTLIFMIPIGIANVMLSPAGLGDVTHAIIMMSFASLFILPVVGWATFAITAFTDREMLVPLWLGGSVMAGTVISFLATAVDYGRGTVNPLGHTLIPYSPYYGLWIGVFALCMLLSSGVCGAIGREFGDPGRVLGLAFKIGCFLFVCIFGVCTIVFR